LAFKDDAMSAFIEGEASIDQVMAGRRDTFALVRIRPQLARDHGQKIVRRPAEIPGHVEVIGHKDRGMLEALAVEAEWVIPPPADFFGNQ
jgi:hypothetical protein